MQPEGFRSSPDSANSFEWLGRRWIGTQGLACFGYAGLRDAYSLTKRSQRASFRSSGFSGKIIIYLMVNIRLGVCGCRNHQMHTRRGSNPLNAKTAFRVCRGAAIGDLPAITSRENGGIGQ